MSYQFRPRWWAVILTLVFVAIFVRLGMWQLSRANEKIDRHEKIAQYAQEPIVTLPSSPIKLDDFLHRLVEVRGRFIKEHAIYLDNKIYQGRVGYEILAPLKMRNSELHVLVNRGWVASGGDRLNLPEIIFPDEEVDITGIVASPMVRAMQLTDEVASGNLWVSLDFELYKEKTGLLLHPVLLLQQDNRIEDGLIRQWAQSDSGASKNIGYAFQWFFFALTLSIIFLILNVKRNSSEK
ncbi:SURF1 family protein [Nitrosomonas sp.]|uniref:SURF1 family protein n=1 Tax=Nitrosomonas sp. TaxID=42353 RepID=UPI002619E6FF|nr:SURF1 family protein [Nitrosomonas sp.]MCW5598627.1 SURF1 family protein [Nitrosomonas sp.]MCW5601021.1 SURF1 family protein [Nitrosomonas sp.]